MTIMNWRISGQEYKHLTRFSRSVLFKHAASTMQKIWLLQSLSLKDCLCRHQFNRLPSPPPGLTPGPLNFSVKIPAPGTAFQCKTPAPGSKKRNKIPTPGHNLPGSNAKISMKKEHNSIKAVSFQIFHNCPFDNFLLP